MNPSRLPFSVWSLLPVLSAFDMLVHLVALFAACGLAFLARRNPMAAALLLVVAGLHGVALLLTIVFELGVLPHSDPLSQVLSVVWTVVAGSTFVLMVWTGVALNLRSTATR